MRLGAWTIRVGSAGISNGRPRDNQGSAKLGSVRLLASAYPLSFWSKLESAVGSVCRASARHPLGLNGGLIVVESLEHGFQHRDASPTQL